MTNSAQGYMAMVFHWDEMTWWFMLAGNSLWALFWFALPILVPRRWELRIPANASSLVITIWAFCFANAANSIARVYTMLTGNTAMLAYVGMLAVLLAAWLLIRSLRKSWVGDMLSDEDVLEQMESRYSISIKPELEQIQGMLKSAREGRR